MIKYYVIFILLFHVIGCQTLSNVFKPNKDNKADNEKTETNKKSFDNSFFDETTPDAKTIKVDVAAPSISTDNKDISGESEIGYASWYGKEMQNKPTAIGTTFNMNHFIGVHKTIPLGSKVLVKNLENNRTAEVKIVDKGPYIEGRIIDVSYAVAKELAFVEAGIAKVEVKVLKKGNFSYLSKIDDTNLSNDDEAGVSMKPDFEKYTFPDGKQPEGFTIQTGAFKVKTNAEKYKKELETLHHNQKVFMAIQGDWFFVWLGDFNSEKDANTFYTQLKKEGIDVMYKGKIK